MTVMTQDMYMMTVMTQVSQLCRRMNAEKTPLLITIDVAGGQVRGNSEMTLLSRQIIKDIKETLSK